jgi:hypothetical protein
MLPSLPCGKRGTLGKSKPQLSFLQSLFSFQGAAVQIVPHP